MELSNEQLLYEAIECNHAGVGSSTLERYRDHLVHFAHYLASVVASVPGPGASPAPGRAEQLLGVAGN
jgi:hypothetical protein